MAKSKGSQNPAGGVKPETKQQRAARRDQAFQCGDCTASFADEVTLGVHAASAHTAGMTGGW